ncbi:MAG: response regulator [Chitinispirillia bacterium]
MSSKVNEGTVFNVFILLISASEATIHRLTDVSPEGNEVVAVIDDDPGVLFVAITFLERFGYETTHFSSAQAFLKNLTTNKRSFDVVVSDLTMPVMSGIQLAHRLYEYNPHLPVIITSGFDEPLHIVTSLPVSIKASLAKPYSAIDLGKTIRRVLSKKSDL